MPFDVLTNRYDNSRAGVNGEETQLGRNDIDPAKFGKLFTRTVDGDLYAQPLIVSKLAINGIVRNVVYLATSRNWVYAYDADDPFAYEPLWTRQLGPAVPRDQIEPSYLNFGREIGITSTPAIERRDAGGAIFVVTKTMAGSGPEATFAQRLHALDLLTGADRIPPVTIDAQLPGRPDVRFNPLLNLNRPGLLLQDGVVYVAFGSHDDHWPYYGWILAYDAATLAQIAAYNTAPDWGEGGIWQSGTGLGGDSDGFVYAVVGNGRKPKDDEKGRPPPPPRPKVVAAPVYGNCLLKLKLDRATRAIEVVDWFTASDVFELNQQDTDFIGGPVLFEEDDQAGGARKYLLGGGKDGKFYLVDRNGFGGWAKGRNPRILQAQKVCAFHIHGAPVVWRRSRDDIRAYVWSEKDALKALRLGEEGFQKIPRGVSDYRLPVNETRMPGGILSLSWDGKDPDTAVLWALHPTREDAMNKTVAGTLRAYNPLDLKDELWNSDMDEAGDDRLGALAKFSSAVVANGKVYVGTFSRELAVYGKIENKPPRDDLGPYDLRDIGPNVWKSGIAGGGKYDLRLSGAGIGEPVEGFLFANIDRNLADSVITVTARLDGANWSQFPNAKAGLIMRRTFEPPVAMAAIAVNRERESVRAVFLIRNEPGPRVKKPKVVRARTIGVVSGLSLPLMLRLTIAAVARRRGWVSITAATARSPTSPFKAIGKTVAMRLDVTEAIDLKVGFFATAEAEHPVPEHAFPAYARFSKVDVA